MKGWVISECLEELVRSDILMDRLKETQLAGKPAVEREEELQSS